MTELTCPKVPLGMVTSATALPKPTHTAPQTPTLGPKPPSDSFAMAPSPTLPYELIAQIFQHVPWPSGSLTSGPMGDYPALRHVSHQFDAVARSAHPTLDMRISSGAIKHFINTSAKNGFVHDSPHLHRILKRTKQVFLNRCVIGDDQTKQDKLVETMSCIPALEALSLPYCRIGDTGVENILNGMRKNQPRSLYKLELIGNNLTRIPHSIKGFNHLISLTLSCNALTTLPESIGDLINLKELGCSYNRLARLPDSIGKLTALSRFYLDNNNIQQLPESVGNLHALTLWWLSNNHLTRLPESVDGLHHIREIWAKSNRLIQLPNNMGNLKKLRILDLEYNALTRIPESLCDIQGLVRLNLSANRLMSLPTNVGNLVDLSYLGIQSPGVGQLDYLPATFENLKNLKRLSLSSRQKENNMRLLQRMQLPPQNMQIIA